MMNKALYIFFILLFLVNGVRAQNNLSDSSDKEAPFLTGYYYTSDQKEEKEFGYVVKEISRRKSVEYLGRKGSLPATFSFPSFPANIRLAFFFRNRKTEIGKMSRSILEYKIIDVSEKHADTSVPWTSTKSVIIIPKLSNGTNYLLMVRYKGEEDKVSAYFFKTYGFWHPYVSFFKKNMVYFLCIFLLINIILLARYLHAKRRYKKYQMELKSLFAQLNPHFIFNSLSSIQGLMNNNEIEKANQYLSGFSGLLRTTLDNGRKDFIKLSEEINNLENYIHFEQLRFNFKFEKDIEPYLAIDEIWALPLLAQPIIENSVKHGISGKGNEGILNMRLYTVGRDLFWAIKDNGKGFDVEDYAAGYGVDLVQKRIKTYNKWHHKTQILFSMKSEPGNTLMVLQFQNWLPK